MHDLPETQTRRKKPLQDNSLQINTKFKRGEKKERANNDYAIRTKMLKNGKILDVKGGPLGNEREKGGGGEGVSLSPFAPNPQENAGAKKKEKAHLKTGEVQQGQEWNAPRSTVKSGDPTTNQREKKQNG